MDSHKEEPKKESLSKEELAKLEEEKQLEEAKKQEENEREFFRKRHNAFFFSKLYNETRATYLSSGFHAVGDVNEEHLKSEGGYLGGGPGPNVSFETGKIYEYKPNKGKSNIMYMEDATGKWARPVPPQGALDKEGYSKTMDFIVASECTDIITINLANADAKPGFNLSELKMLIELAREKKLGIEFVGNTKAAIAKMPVEDQRYLEAERLALEENRQKKQMLLEAKDDRVLRGSGDLRDKKSVEEFKKEAYKDAGNDDSIETTEKKLAAIDKERNRLEKELTEAQMYRERVDIRIDAQANLLQKPHDLIKTADDLLLKHPDNKKAIENRKERYKDLENVVEDIEKRYNKDFEEGSKIISNIKNKYESLKAQRAMWKKELGDLKVEDKIKTLEDEKKGIDKSDPNKKEKEDKINKELQKWKSLDEKVKKMDKAWDKLDENIQAEEKKLGEVIDTKIKDMPNKIQAAHKQVHQEQEQQRMQRPLKSN